MVLWFKSDLVAFRLFLYFHFWEKFLEVPTGELCFSLGQKGGKAGELDGMGKVIRPREFGSAPRLSDRFSTEDLEAIRGQLLPKMGGI